jgi:hypothetical protein
MYSCHMIIEVCLTLAYTCLFLLIISRSAFFKMEGLPISFTKAVFLLKISAGILLGLIYTRYYTDRKTADIFKYFDDSAILFNALFTKPYDFIRMLTGYDASAADLQHYYVEMTSWNNSDNIYNDNRNLIRLNTVLRFFSMGKYYVHTVFMCFISLCGLIGIYKVLNEEVKGKSYEIFFAVFLLPSVLFWNSGMLKDGLMIFAFGILFYNFHLLITKGPKAGRIVIILLTAMWLSILKLYILMIIFPGFLLLFFFKKIPRLIPYTFSIFALTYFLYFLVIFNLKYIFHDYDFAHMIYRKQFNFLNLIAMVKSNSAIEIPLLKGNAWSIISNSPHAIFTILFRPYIWEAHAVFILMAALENLLIIFLGILTLLSLDLRQPVNKPLMAFSICFVLILYALTGLVTPVMGAFVRYKVPALPFLVLVFIMVYNREKLKSRFSFLTGKK